MLRHIGAAVEKQGSVAYLSIFAANNRLVCGDVVSRVCIYFSCNAYHRHVFDNGFLGCKGLLEVAHGYRRYCIMSLFILYHL